MQVQQRTTYVGNHFLTLEYSFLNYSHILCFYEKTLFNFQERRKTKQREISTADRRRPSVTVSSFCAFINILMENLEALKAGSYSKSRALYSGRLL